MRLIDADKAMKHLSDIAYTETENKNLLSKVIFTSSYIGDRETVDAEPVVHAHWETNYSNNENEVYYSCSKCHYPVNCWARLEGKYCLNCGAKMDEEAQE